MLHNIVKENKDNVKAALLNDGIFSTEGISYETVAICHSFWEQSVLKL